MIGNKGIKRSELISFNKTLSLMLLSRLNILQALEIIFSETKNKSFRAVLKKIITEVKSGSSLSKSFSKYPKLFPDIYIANLKVAEETGEVAEVLMEYTKYEENVENLKRKIVQASRYPLLVLVVAFLVVVFMVFFLIPTFQGLFSSSKLALPPLTAVIMDISVFIKENSIVILLLISALGFSLKGMKRMDSVKSLTDRLLLEAPLIPKLYTRNTLARFSLSMAILLRSRVTLLEALKISKNISSNRLFRSEIDFLVRKLIKGENISSNIQNSRFFDLTFIRMLKVGEESAELEKVFSLIGSYYSKEFDYYLDNLTSLIEPVLILFIGLIVALILVAMYMPMFELVNNFGV